MAAPRMTARDRVLQRLALGLAGPVPTMASPMEGQSLAALAPVSMADALPESEGIATTAQTPEEAGALEISAPTRPDYEALLAQSRRAASGAELARAGAMINEAMTGAPAPMGLYDRLGERAREPLADYTTTRAIRREDRKAEQDAALLDPDSPESVRRQDAFARFNPEIASRLNLTGKRYAWTDLESLLKGAMGLEQFALRGRALDQGDRRLGIQETAEERRAADTDADRALKAKIAEVQERLGWANLNVQQERLATQIALEEMRGERAEKKAEGKDTDYQAALRVPGWERATDAPKIKVEEAQKLRNADGVNKSMLQTIDDMIALKKEYGVKINPGSDAYQRMKSLRTSLLTMMKEAEQLGSLDAGVERVAAGQLPDPSTPGGMAVARLEEWKRNLINKHGNYLRANGYTPAGQAAPAPNRAPASAVMPKDKSGNLSLEQPPLSAKDKEALDWLKANPDNPNAPAVRERLKRKGVRL